jgi:glutamyl-tRNA reductase
MADLILFGVSFRTAPVAVRKTLSFDTGAIGDLLRRASEELPGVEALVLSTCNRTEFYLGAADTGPWHELLKRFRPEAPASPADCHFYERREADAFRHLARLACGLESAILGDSQILSQIRAAVSLAQEHGTLGGELGRATSAAVRVGRAARAGTAIAAGGAGIGSAVAATIRPDATRVAVLGAGEAARSVARHLTKRGIVDLTFCNRTAERARRLAVEYGGRALAWSEVESVLRSVDAVAVATSAPAPVLESGVMVRIADWRDRAGQPPLTVIDAGFPPQVASPAPVPGVRVISLEGLRQGENGTLAAREAAVPAVEAMVEEAVDGWMRRRSERNLSETIRRLNEHADRLSRELAVDLVGLGVAAREAERIARRPMRRLLHDLIGELRDVEAAPARMSLSG